MAFQKYYSWFCFVSWTFWGIAIALSFASGGAYQPHSPEFYGFVYWFSRIACLSCLIPISPVVSIAALIFALRRKQKDSAILAACNTFLVTPLMAFFLFAGWAYVSGA